MFPIAHGWLLAELTEQPAAAAYLGCVWPDMLFGSPLAHPQSHQSGAGLLAFARGLPAGAERDEFMAFVRGVITHGSEPHGFDWFSDEGYGEVSMFMIIFQFHVHQNFPVAPPLPSRLSGLEKWKRERRVHAAAAVDGNSARAW